MLLGIQMAQDDGHRYFFGQMPHAPWKGDSYILDRKINVSKRILLQRMLLILQMNMDEEMMMYYINELLKNNQDIALEVINNVPPLSYDDLDEIVKKIE